MKTVRYVLVAVLVTLAVLLVAVYAASPWLASLILPGLLADYGIEAVEFETRRPGATEIEIPRARFAIDNVQAEIRGLTISYSPMQVLMGRLRDVRAEHVAIEIDRPSEDGSAASDPTLSLPPWLGAPIILWESVPADSVTLERISVTSKQPALALEGSARLDVDSLTLDLTGELRDLPQRLLVNVNLTRAGVGLLSLRTPGIEVPIVELETDADAPDALLQGRFAVVWPREWPGAADLRGRFLAAEQSVRIDVAAGSTFRVPAAVSKVPGWQGPIDGTIDVAGLQVVANQDGLWVHGDVHATSQSGSVTAAVTIREVAMDWDVRSSSVHRAEANVDWQLDVEGSDEGGSIIAQGAAGVSWHDTTIAIRIMSGARVVVAAYQTADKRWSLAPTIAESQDDTTIEIDIDDTAYHIARSAWHIESELDWDGVGYRSHADLSVANVQGAGDGNFAHDWRLSLIRGSRGIRGDEGDGMRANRELLTLEGTLEGTASRLEGVALASISGFPTALPVRASYDLDRPEALATVTLDHTLTGALLAGLIPDVALDYDLTAGILQATAELAWREKTGLVVDVRGSLRDGAGHYSDQLTAQDMDMEFQLQISDGNVVMLPGSFRIGALDAGIPLRALRGLLSYRNDVVEIANVQANLLGGSARLTPIEYYMADSTADFRVTLDGLDLAQVLALEGEDVTGTGILDGRLHVRLDGSAIVVEGGELDARDPGGNIRVAQAAVAANALSELGLGFAVEALADFNYDKLHVGVDYAADGALALAVRLEGRNPAIEGGRPLHYNLNINENLLDLLNSLRLADEVSDRVERRITQ
ncbi:MAG: YdbH domain-containing protein [Gammaproteobacteria bacterium]|nr:YdbH domain-containing protein [Gammaproteobacteria bacterium]